VLAWGCGDNSGEGETDECERIPEHAEEAVRVPARPAVDTAFGITPRHRTIFPGRSKVCS
jgi:hypothetical protein